MLAERSLPHTADRVRRETCASPSRERMQVQPWNVDVAKMKPVGEDHHQRLRRIAQAAIEPERSRPRSSSLGCASWPTRSASPEANPLTRRVEH